MIFRSPSWVPDLPIEIPTTLTVGDFVLQGVGGQRSPADEEEVLTDALTGVTYSIQGLVQRVDHLARGLAHDLGWSPKHGDAADKVVGILSFNTIDYIIACWAIHRLNGTVLTLYTSSSEETLKRHVEVSKCKAIFTCHSLSVTSEKLAADAGIPADNLYLMSVSDEPNKEALSWKTLEQLVEAGSKLSPLEPLQWKDGQGSKQIAFLTATSGTSGKQRLAKITHKNIIANILQTTTFESFANKNKTEVSAMVLPFSHAYTLEVSQMMMWRGDRVILHPRFHVMKMLESIKQFRIQRLYLVPAIISALAKNPYLLEMYDCSSVNSIVSGAGPLTKDVSSLLSTVKPDWDVLGAYGLTETSIVVTFTSPHDIFLGSSGSLLPQIEMRLVDSEGKDVEGYDQRGEVLLKGPNNISGYLDDDNAYTLIDSDGWLHTGDVGLVRVHSEAQTEHLFIVDRMKDMIKVNGIQVAPVDIEARLLTHPGVEDAAVIGIPDETAGERPQAYVVRSPKGKAFDSEKDLRLSINKEIEAALNSTHWLGNRIVFIDEIPRNQSGKVLKEVLKERARNSG